MRILLVLTLFTASLFGADVTGKWTAETEGRNGEKRTQIITLKADGDKLTGTVATGQGAGRDITDGKIKGDEISFTVTGNNDRKMNYTGKVEGGEIKFKVEGGQRTREFTAKRAAS